MMPNPVPVTLFTAGLLGLIYLALTVGVVRGRFALKLMLGDGAGSPKGDGLFVAVRAHANFAEYVPLALILLGGIEWAGAPRLLCIVLAAMLIIGRIAHPLGMGRPSPNPFRAGGAMLTWVMIGIASLTALVIAA
jgi:uncharacterized membrane protein YecN with MAPEG domain